MGGAYRGSNPDCVLVDHAPIRLEDRPLIFNNGRPVPTNAAIQSKRVCVGLGLDPVPRNLNRAKHCSSRPGFPGRPILDKLCTYGGGLEH